MTAFLEIDWGELFAISMPVAEIIIRGSAIYWFLFVIFRFIVRRDVGAVGVADILVLVLVADAAQNAMAGEYKSIGDGFVLISTLVFWNVALDWICFHVPAIRRFIEPKPSCLVQDSRMLKRNMRKELISEEELWTKLREQGIDSLDQVKKATLEPDGEISVIKR